MDMKKWVPAIPMILGASFCAAEGPSGLMINAGLEGWAVADAYKKTKKAAQDEKTDYDLAGYNTAVNRMDDSVGRGVRVGVFKPVSPSFDLGASVGYITGPETDITVEATDDVFLNETDEVSLESNFTRLLIESRGKVSLSGGEARLKLGAGYALGAVKSHSRFSDELGPISEGTFKDTWSGLTWEVSPSLAFPAKGTMIEIGFVYAGFPKLKGSANLDEFVWTPTGFRLTVEF